MIAKKKKPVAKKPNKKLGTTKKKQPKKLPTAKRRQIIKQQIQDYGLWNINKSDIAKQLGVERHTIKKDVDLIIENLDENDLKETHFEISSCMKQAIRKTRNILNSEHFPETSTTAKLTLQAAQTLSNLCREYTSMLESYGKKDVTPQVLKHEGEAVSFRQVNVMMDEALKKVKE